MSIRRMALGVLSAAALGVTLLATPAFAGSNPTPTYSPTGLPTVNPTPTTCAQAPRFVGPSWNWNWSRNRDRKCTQQEFDIQFASLLPADAHGDGALLATGPIHFRGLDVSPVVPGNPFVDEFETDGTGANSFRVHHQLLGGATIDRVTCSIDLAQVDQPWNIVPGSGRGIYANVIGNGFYNLAGQISYPTVRNICTLPFGLTPGRALFLLNFFGGRGLPTPLAEDVSVQAVGLAAVQPAVNPCPTAYTDSWEYSFGQPTDCPTPYASPINS